MGDQRRIRTRARSVTAGVALVVGMVAGACTPASEPDPTVDGWVWTPTQEHPLTRTQGIATDPTTDAAGPASWGYNNTWYSSQFSLERLDAQSNPLKLVWSPPLDVLLIDKHTHTGDIDAYGGKIIVPWENKQIGPSNPPSKAFGVYNARTLELEGWSRHVLVDDEINDNPWVAVSPNGEWMVSGPYRPLDRLEVFPRLQEPFGDIALAATITVSAHRGDPQPTRIQGCDFIDATHLVCASNNHDSYKQVFTLELDAPIGEGATTATATYHGSLPQEEPLVQMVRRAPHRARSRESTYPTSRAPARSSGCS